MGDRCGDAEGWLHRPRLALAPCPSLACPAGPGVDAGPLTWALSTGLPAEDGDHHLRREGAAAGQRLCEGAEYVPGPPTPLLFPLLPSRICHHYDQTDSHPPDKVRSPCQPGLSSILLKTRGLPWSCVVLALISEKLDARLSVTHCLNVSLIPVFNLNVGFLLDYWNYVMAKLGLASEFYVEIHRTVGNPLSSDLICKSQGKGSQLYKYTLLSTVSIVSLQVKIRQRGEQNILSFSRKKKNPRQ